MTEKEGVVRVYAKYIFLDVVQFSKRSAEAQSDIVQHLNEIVRQVLNSYSVNADKDSILIPTGDGMCIALISSSLPYDSHIQISFTILESLNDYNERTQDETRRFQLRIGINQNTDILVTDINGGVNMAGAGITMASRIMDKADGGQILVSQAVQHELEPSERYMNRFRRFTATGKHGVTFEVHQYIGEGHKGLNVEAPTAFAIRKPERNKLSEQTAHYFSQAIIHRDDLIRIKKGQHVFWPSAAVTLLRLLAYDSYRLSNASEYGEAPDMHTWGAGKKTIDEQYEYYASQDTWVLSDAQQYAASGELKLSQHAECFEYSDYEYHYEFINKTGVDRLKEDWPDIWNRYDLDRLVREAG